MVRWSVELSQGIRLYPNQYILILIPNAWLKVVRGWQGDVGNMGMSARKVAAGIGKYLNQYTEILIPNAWLMRGNMGMSPRRVAAGASKYLNPYTESLIPKAWLTVVRG